MQDAAKTYFGVNAADLNWPQAALLAGMVQSTSMLNPYTNPDAALARRNLVLDTLVKNVPDSADEIRAAKTKPLGMLPQPEPAATGLHRCGRPRVLLRVRDAVSGRAGIGMQQCRGQRLPDPYHAGSQDAGHSEDRRSTRSPAPPCRGRERDQRDHARQRCAPHPGHGRQPQVRPRARLRRNGAAAAVHSRRRRRGSVFKVFTTAAALEMGMGINAQLDVPPTFQPAGLGDSNTPGCPPRTWCVKNAGGGYRGPMNVTDALAKSPNTAFAKLIQQVGVPRAVDMAVRLGMRSYAEPGTARDYDPDNKGSLADYVKQQNIGSFTLGPFELNALELSNVAATLASGGMWCPPNPIDKVIDRHGREVPSRRRNVNRWSLKALPTRWPTRSARTTPAGPPPARPVRWDGACRCRARPVPPNPTGRRHSSASPTSTPQRTTSSTTPPPSELCSWPLRQCSSGNLYGGNEPARTWYLAMKPIANDLGPVAMPPTDPAM